MDEQRITKAVIPAAGRGTRLLPATRSQPKEMLPLGRKPCIQYVAEELAGAGITDILIITGKDKRAIEDHFDLENSAPGNASNAQGVADAASRAGGPFNIFYIRQGEPRGTAHAVSLAEAFVKDEPFVVAFGDVTIHSSEPGSLIRRLVRTHQVRKACSTVGVRQVSPEHVSRYGIVVPCGDVGEEAFPIGGVVEKPAPEHAPSSWAFAARYVFGPEIFGAIRTIGPASDGELQLTDAIQLLAEKDLAVWAVPFAEGEVRYEVGNFESYFTAFAALALQDEEVGPSVRNALLTYLNNDPADRRGGESCAK